MLVLFLHQEFAVILGLLELLKIFFNSEYSTSDETERRSRQIEVLLTKAVQMQKLFDHQVSNAPSDRSLLMGNSEWASRREVDIHDPPLESVDEIRSEQSRMLGGKININNFIIFTFNIILL